MLQRPLQAEPSTADAHLGSVRGRRRGRRSCRCLSALFIGRRGLRRPPRRGLGATIGPPEGRLSLPRGGHGLCLVPLQPWLRGGEAGVLLPAVDALVDDGNGDIARPELGVSHVSFSGHRLLGAVAGWAIC